MTTDFINNKVRGHVTTVNYNNFKDLCDKIQNSIIDHYFNRKAKIVTPSNNFKISQEIANDEKALRMLVGILDSQIATTVKEDVLTSYFLECLSLSGSNPQPILTCFEKLSRVLQIDKNKIEADINRLLPSLINSGKIIKLKENFYKLSDFQAKKLSEIDNKISEQEKMILSYYYDIHSKILDSISQIDYSKIIKESISKLVYLTAYINAKIQVSGDTNPISYDAEELNRTLLSIIYELKPTQGSISNWLKSISEILQSSNINIVNWINRIYKAYWALAALGVDPDCATFKRKHLKNYCIYLDSHIVIRALVEAGSESNMCANMINIGHDSAVEMRLSESIFNEVEKSFEAANKVYQSSEKDIFRAIEFFKKLNRKSDIFDGFLLQKKINKHLSWEQFINRFYSPTGSSKLKSYIEEEMGINLVMDSDFSIEEWECINEIVDLLLKMRSKPIKTSDEINNEHQDDYDRQLILRTNEAKQMGIIYALRQKERNAHKQYWFITFDEFIYKASIDLANKNNPFYRFPCYMKPTRWFEILVHSSTKPLEVNTFREILMSPTFQFVADSIESEVISEMLNARADKKIKSVNTLQNMFSDISSRQAVQDAYEEVVAASTGRQKLEASEKVKDTIINAMSEEMNKLKLDLDKKEETIKKERKEKEKNRKKADYYKNQYSNTQRLLKGNRKKK
ncbi:hypothetical protein KAZ01_01785 [Candidatus Gracilibacteria bacterium]|nr:hypothetical protein [Candidatus Gracilibacteria bacterium]